MRDKHVAHSVNPFEQTHVVAVLSPEGSGSPQVLGSGVAHLRFNLTDREGMTSLWSLAGQLATKVGEMANAQMDAVTAYAKAQPIERIYEMPRQSFSVAGPEQAGEARP